MPAIAGEGRALFEAVSAQGLFGIRARQRASPYLPGVRSRMWRTVASMARSCHQASSPTSEDVEVRSGHARARPRFGGCATTRCRPERWPVGDRTSATRSIRNVGADVPGSLIPAACPLEFEPMATAVEADRPVRPSPGDVTRAGG